MKIKATKGRVVWLVIAVLLGLLIIPSVIFLKDKGTGQSLADSVASAPAPVQEAYAYAVAHPDILRYIPCYCGCIAAGHGSNEDCFVDERLASGSVVYDAMGIG